MSQALNEWKQNPLTKNFFEGVNEAIEFYTNSITNIDVNFNERELARKIGVKQGLEALLTYDPEVDEDTGEVIVDEI